MKTIDEGIRSGRDSPHTRYDNAEDVSISNACRTLQSADSRNPAHTTSEWSFFLKMNILHLLYDEKH